MNAEPTKSWGSLNFRDTNEVFRLAASLVDSGDSAAVRVLFKEWLDKGVGTARDLSRAGSLLFRLNLLDEAEVYYLRALAVDEQFLPAYNNLATLYIQKGSVRKALKLINKGLDILSAIRESGKPVADKTEYDEDVSLLRQALGPASPERTKGVDSAVAVAASGDSDQFDLLRRAVEMAPAENLPGSPDEETEKVAMSADELIADYESEGKLASVRDDYLLLVAKAYAGKGDVGRGISLCEEWLESNPADSRGYRVLGELLLLSGRSAEALESFNSALDIDDNDTLSWIGKAEALQQLKEYETALAAVKRAMDLGPISARSYLLLAQILLKTGKKEEAEEAVRSAFEFPLELPPFYSALIDAVDSLGFSAEAKLLAKTLVAEYPHDSKVKGDAERCLMS